MVIRRPITAVDDAALGDGAIGVNDRELQAARPGVDDKNTSARLFAHQRPGTRIALPPALLTLAPPSARRASLPASTQRHCWIARMSSPWARSHSRRLALLP